MKTRAKALVPNIWTIKQRIKLYVNDNCKIPGSILVTDEDVNKIKGKLKNHLSIATQITPTYIH